MYQTERLVLLPTTEEDAEFLLKLLHTPKWLKHIGNRNVNTIEEAKEYIRVKMLPQFDRLGYANYTIIRKSDNLKIGTCGLYDREGINGIDIGFAMLPKYEKNGYAYEANNKLKNMAFDIFKINEIKAITTKENTASQKLLKKLDFKYVGITKLSDEEYLLYKSKKKTNEN